MSWVMVRPKRATVRAFQYQPGVKSPNIEIFTNPEEIPKTIGSSGARAWLSQNLDQMGAVARVRGRWFTLFPGNWIVEEGVVNLSILTDEQFQQLFEFEKKEE